MKTKFKIPPIVKYAAVGCSGTIIDLGLLYLLVEFANLPILIATTISFVTAASNNFIWNKIWTFKNSSTNYRKLYIKFLIISTVGLLLTNTLMFLLITFSDIWYLIGKVMVSAVVFIWNFLGNKYWTFSTKLAEFFCNHYPYKISVIIPAYNEEKRLGQTLLGVSSFLEQQPYKSQIIVVNDGSTDQTAQIVKQFPPVKLIDLAKNQGKGGAISRGVKSANGQYILISDADNSTPITELTKLLDALKQEDADIAIGSRYLKASNVIVKQPKHRILIGRLGNLLIQLFLIKDIVDTQCGFKLFKNKIAKKLFHKQKIERWGFDMELLAIAQANNYKIVEVPVSWLDSTDSRFRPFKDSLRTLTELIYIKFNLLSGRYND